MARCVDGLLERTETSSSDVDRVFLTGGSSLVPAVRRLFEDRFGNIRRQFTVDINGTWDLGSSLFSLSFSISSANTLESLMYAVSNSDELMSSFLLYSLFRIYYFEAFLFLRTNLRRRQRLV